MRQLRRRSPRVPGENIYPVAKPPLVDTPAEWDERRRMFKIKRERVERSLMRKGKK